MRLMILEINATLMQCSKSITLITVVIPNKVYSYDVFRKQMYSYCRDTLNLKTFKIVYQCYLHTTERKDFHPYILLRPSGNYTPFYQFYPICVGFK